MLPRVLAAFRAEHPGVELALQVENTQAIEDKLIAGEIDIGFAEGIIRRDILDYQVFAQEEPVLIAATRHAAAKASALSMYQLQTLTLPTHETDSGTRAVTTLAPKAKQ